MYSGQNPCSEVVDQSDPYTHHILEHTMRSKVNLNCRWCQLSMEATRDRQREDIIEDPEG